MFLFSNAVVNFGISVQKPREQVADAEALLGLTSTLVSCVKSQHSEGLTPSDFVFCLIRNFGQSNRAISTQEDAQNSICWKDIGVDVSHVFSKAPGCCTMWVVVYIPQVRLFTLFTLAVGLSAFIVLLFHGLIFLGFFSNFLKAWTYEYWVEEPKDCGW